MWNLNSDHGFRVARVDIEGINIIGFELALKTGSERTTSPPAILLNIDPPSNVGRVTSTECCSIETYLSAIKSWMTLIANYRNRHKKQKFTLKSGKLQKTSISSEWRHNHVVCYSKNKVLKNIVLRFLGRLSEILAAEFQKPVTVGIALYNFEMRTCWWCVMQISPSALGIMTPLRCGWRNGFVITILKKLCFSKNWKNEKISTNPPLVDDNSKIEKTGGCRFHVK